MGAEHLPQPAVPAFSEEMQIELTDSGPRPIRIVKAIGELPTIVLIGRLQLVAADPFPIGPS